MKFLIKNGIKYAFKRKARNMGKKFNEMVELSKLNDMIKREEEEENCGKAWKIVLIVLGVLAALAGIGYLVYRLFVQQTDDYDLYDDLDNYYVDEDYDKEHILKDLGEEIEDGLEEADFAE